MMFEEQLVSVVVTTFGRPFSMVERALTSVLQQTYDHLEIVLVDDNGMKNTYTADIKSGVNRLKDERIRLIQHEVNRGANQARNTGVINSNGEFVAFLDDDDEWLPKKIEQQLEKFYPDESVGLVYCDKYVALDMVKQPYKKNPSMMEGWVFEKLMSKNFIGSTSLVIIRRTVFGKCGLFDVEMPASQDYELWLRISRMFKVRVVREPLVLYHKHSALRISSSPEKKMIACEKIIEKYEDYLKTHKKVYAENILYYLKFFEQVHGLKKSLGLWKKAFTLNPISPRVYGRLYKILTSRKAHIHDS